MSSGLNEIAQAYLEVNEAYNGVFSSICDLSPQKQTILDNADCTLLLKKMEQQLDDLRKECKRRRELCEKVACLRYIQGGDIDPIRGKLSVCTPSVRQEASIPHPQKDKVEFNELMDWLGIPKEQRDWIRVSWKGFSDELSRRAAEGRSLPPGIDPTKTIPIYSLTARAKGGPENLTANVREYVSISNKELENVE